MNKNRLIWIVVAIGTVLVLSVQYCIRTIFESKQPVETIPTIPLLPGILHLTYLRLGAAFSLFGGVKQLLILIQIGSILFVIAVTFFISWLLSKWGKNMIKSLQIGVGLLLAGAISNTVEKIIFNENAVFIDFQLFQIPVFNVADMFIYLGQVISIISLLFLGIKFAIKQWRTN
jgi:signal peptidase II